MVTASINKHIKTLGFRLLGETYTRIAIKKKDWWTLVRSIISPYHYDAQKYIGTFLESPCLLPFDEINEVKVNRVIYVFWTGENEITPNRKIGLKSLENCSGVEVKLITPKNLNDYILPEDPLPEAFQYLSLVHKSDFLRGYFMYHYGGGYADIKTFYHSWVSAFDALDNYKEAYALGYPEVSSLGVAKQSEDNKVIQDDLTVHWRLLIGNGAFICRKRTRFTAEWYGRVRQRLLESTEVLRQHPATDAFGKNEDYPISWSFIQGEIFHPYCLKYHKLILKDKRLMPSFKDYR